MREGGMERERGIEEHYRSKSEVTSRSAVAQR